MNETLQEYTQICVFQRKMIEICGTHIFPVKVPYICGICENNHGLIDLFRAIR